MIFRILCCCFRLMRCYTFFFCRCSFFCVVFTVFGPFLPFFSFLLLCSAFLSFQFFFLLDVVIFLLSVVAFCVEDSVIFSVFLSVVAFFSCVVGVSVVTSSVAVCVVPCVVTFSFCISFVKCCFFLPAFIFFNTIESPKKTNTMQKSRIIINPAFFHVNFEFF